MLAVFKKKKPLPETKELINTCAKCSMAKFVDCIVNGNTHVVDDWGAIFEEYLSLSEDPNTSTMLELCKSISLIENKIAIIQICVDQLSKSYDTGIANHLRSLGFRFQYEDGPELLKELELTVTQSRGYLVQLSQEKAELQELKDKNNSGVATMQDYEMQYSAISEFLGTMVNPETYMVSRYIADTTRMRERYKPKSA